MIEVTAAIIIQNDKYLICQRAADDSCPLLWEFPGGKLEPGETLVQCIAREIKEELDLEIAVKSIYAETDYSFGEKQLHFTFFLCDIVSGEIKLNVHKAFAWVTAEEIKAYEFMPADVEIVERATKDGIILHKERTSNSKKQQQHKRAN